MRKNPVSSVAPLLIVALVAVVAISGMFVMGGGSSFGGGLTGAQVAEDETPSGGDGGGGGCLVGEWPNCWVSRYAPSDEEIARYGPVTGPITNPDGSLEWRFADGNKVVQGQDGTTTNTFYDFLYDSSYSAGESEYNNDIPDIWDSPQTGDEIQSGEPAGCIGTGQAFGQGGSARANWVVFSSVLFLLVVAFFALQYCGRQKNHLKRQR